MLKQTRTKASRHRGSSSHGWGHKKKHRGAGHRGGKGFSGTGQRGDQRNPSVVSGAMSFFKQLSAKKGVKLKKIMKNYIHFGKRGFTSIDKSSNKVLSLNYIECYFDKMVEQGLIAKDKNDYVFNARDAGYDKILGKGTFTKKLTIIVDEMSASAIAKVKEAGGKVELLNEDNSDETEE